MAADKDIWMHVDACVGGLELPFVKKLGYPLPDFDFQIPGVCSISADIHKYGFTPKGASVILYRNPEMRKHQLFAYADWPGGVYATPNVSGSRPGGPIGSSWAVLRYLGMEGYMNLAAKSMETTKRLIKGIESIPELFVLGNPPTTVFAIGSDVLNIFALGEKMKEYRWNIDSQHLPPCLHMTISPIHAGIVDPFWPICARRSKKRPAEAGGYQRGGGHVRYDRLPARPRHGRRFCRTIPERSLPRPVMEVWRPAGRCAPRQFCLAWHGEGSQRQLNLMVPPWQDHQGPALAKPAPDLIRGRIYSPEGLRVR